MSTTQIQQMADRISDLLDERQGQKRGSLSHRARKAWRLPPRVRRAALELGQMAEQAANPKLRAQLDPVRGTKCYEICQRHLLQCKPRDGGLLGRALGVLAAVVFGLLLIGAAVLLVKWLQGQL